MLLAASHEVFDVPLCDSPRPVTLILSPSSLPAFCKCIISVHARLHISACIPVCRVDVRKTMDCPKHTFFLAVLSQNETLLVLEGARLVFFNAAGTIICPASSMIDVLGHKRDNNYGTWLCYVECRAFAIGWAEGGYAGPESALCLEFVGGHPQIAYTAYTLNGSTPVKRATDTSLRALCLKIVRSPSEMYVNRRVEN